MILIINDVVQLPSGSLLTQLIDFNAQDITCFYINICKSLTTLYLIDQFCGPSGSLMTHLTDFLQFLR